MTEPSFPVSGKSRIQSIDTLRGVALLGILLMNIIAFANPFAAYLIPTTDSAGSGLNLATFMTMDIFVEGSMRAIFSMLFGAGMLIFLNKPEADPGIVKNLFYRRTLLLVVFGLFNAYVLLWVGDILYAYGMTGFVLYLFAIYPRNGWRSAVAPFCCCLRLCIPVATTVQAVWALRLMRSMCCQRGLR